MEKKGCGKWERKNNGESMKVRCILHGAVTSCYMLQARPISWKMTLS